MSRENLERTEQQQLELDKVLWSKIIETNIVYKAPFFNGWIPNFNGWLSNLNSWIYSFSKPDQLSEVRKLLDQGARASASGKEDKDGNGWGNRESVLTTAAINGKVDICKLLISRDPSIVNEKKGNWTYSAALERVASLLVSNKDHKEVIDLLFKHGAKLPPKEPRQIKDSILAPYFLAIEKLGKIIDRPNDHQERILAQGGNDTYGMTHYYIARKIIDSSRGDLDQINNIISTIEKNNGLKKIITDIFGKVSLNSFSDQQSPKPEDFAAEYDKFAFEFKNIISQSSDKDDIKFRAKLEQLISNSKIFTSEAKKDLFSNDSKSSSCSSQASPLWEERVTTSPNSDVAITKR